MSEAAAVAAKKSESLAERFWALARGMSGAADSIDPVAVVRHVLAVLDALAAGEGGGDSISVRTVSFLKLLRESEQLGELSYAAPEQICGEMLDERSLVFSVGVLLFERLTGRHPFGAEGNNPRRLARIQKGEFGSGVNYFPTVPTGLRQILMKAMGPFPEERWATLDEMRDRLEQFVDRERQPLSLPGTSPPKRRVPVSDNAPTQIVNMAERVATERLFAAGRAATEPSLATLVPAAAPPPTPPRPDAGAPAVPQSPAETSPLSIPLLPTVAPELDPDEAPSLRSKLPLAQIAWVGTGAAITTLLFILLGGSSPAPIAAQAVAPSATTPAPSQSPPAVAPLPPARPAPAPQVPLPSVADEAGTFDPEASGGLVASAARACFAPEKLARGLSFSLGILYESSDGHIKRVYYPSDEEISVEERRCIRAALTGQLANRPPTANTIVNYRLRLADAGDRIRFKLP